MFSELAASWLELLECHADFSTYTQTLGAIDSISLCASWVWPSPAHSGHSKVLPARTTLIGGTGLTPVQSDQNLLATFSSCLAPVPWLQDTPKPIYHDYGEYF